MPWVHPASASLCEVLSIAAEWCASWCGICTAAERWPRFPHGPTQSWSSSAPGCWTPPTETTQAEIQWSQHTAPGPFSIKGILSRTLFHCMLAANFSFCFQDLTRDLPPTPAPLDFSPQHGELHLCLYQFVASVFHSKLLPILSHILIHFVLFCCCCFSWNW